MAAGRSSKNLVSRRRRVGEDEDEEEDGPVLVGDSQSEGSVLSEPGDEGDVSTVDDDQVAETRHQSGDTNAEASTNGHKAARNKTKKSMKNGINKEASNNKIEHPAQATDFQATSDTAAMLQGLQISDGAQDAVDFAELKHGNEALQSTNAGAGANTSKQPAVRQKKEHEEYRKQRDSNPAFIPNRGNFFMHDTRGQYNGGPLSVRSPAVGKGRGRGGQNNVTDHNINVPPSRAERPSETLWKHDLHDSINKAALETYDHAGKSSARLFTRPSNQEPPATNPESVSFSSTNLLGRVQVRVYLPGMPKAITYAEVPLKKYVRLPDHRPPLRRDKPVRILLPNIGPKYIFPATERSFIFIPRQMRPNHRGFGNNSSNSHTNNQRSIGGYGYSSRRTSMYGGSVYSGSIAASRRSSIARDREGMFSPGSYASGFQPPNRPVVRLPRSGHFYGNSTPPVPSFPVQHTPVHQLHTYPLPQQPAFQGTPTTTVQHPRPQKAISVSGIESPAALTQRHTPADQQPFHSQLPMHLTEHPPPGAMPYYSPRQQYAYPATMAQIASPLSQIPEQSAGYQAPQQMYSYPQQPYYYGSVPMPMYMVPPPPLPPPSQQQQGYMYASAGASQQSHHDQAHFTQSNVSDTQAQQASGMLAHESHGMVFYMPASEATAQTNSTDQYQPAEGFVPNYAAPGLSHTPAPDHNGYYYMGGNIPNSAYYQPMQQG